MDWTREEVTYIVQDYFSMLELDLQGQKYNKAGYRQALSGILNKRSAGSIEFKHQNISAVLAVMGLPFIRGYKPRFNYQRLLEEEVSAYLITWYAKLAPVFDQFSQKVPEKNAIQVMNFQDLEVDGPDHKALNEPEPVYRPVKINYLEREQNNRKLGEQGEELILEYEKWRLIKSGKEKLADQVEWVSKEQGDGLGFDILSKNINGTDRYIEVKTTKLTKETPIYLTRNEVRFAHDKQANFFLYRVFNWAVAPQFFMKAGAYTDFCTLESLTYKGFF